MLRTYSTALHFVLLLEGKNWLLSVSSRHLILSLEIFKQSKSERKTLGLNWLKPCSYQVYNSNTGDFPSLSLIEGVWKDIRKEKRTTQSKKTGENKDTSEKYKLIKCINHINIILQRPSQQQKPSFRWPGKSRASANLALNKNTQPTLEIRCYSNDISHLEYPYNHLLFVGSSEFFT